MPFLSSFFLISSFARQFSATDRETKIFKATKAKHKLYAKNVHDALIEFITLSIDFVIYKLRD